MHGRYTFKTLYKSIYVYVENYPKMMINYALLATTIEMTSTDMTRIK